VEGQDLVQPKECGLPHSARRLKTPP
jgi:hypothetical protein